MSYIERDFNGNIFSSSYYEADLQLVVGADDLQSIIREIDFFQANSTILKMTVTSPAGFTGAIRFGESTCLNSPWAMGVIYLIKS